MKKNVSMAFVAICAILLCSFSIPAPQASKQPGFSNRLKVADGYLGTATLEWDSSTPPSYTPVADVYVYGGVYEVYIRLIISGQVEAPGYSDGTITVETASTLSTSGVTIYYPGGSCPVKSKVYSF